MCEALYYLLAGISCGGTSLVVVITGEIRSIDISRGDIRRVVVRTSIKIVSQTDYSNGCLSALEIV